MRASSASWPCLVGDDVVVDALLLGEEELGIGRLGPEIDDLAHRREEVGGKGAVFGKPGSFSTALAAE